MAACAGAWFLVNGRPASWSEIDDLNRVYRPEMRLAPGDLPNGEVKPAQPANLNDER